MTDLLTQHVAIVRQAQREGVTDRAGLIRVVLQWHVDRKQHWWTTNDCAKMVDLTLFAIKREKEQQNGKS